MENLDRGLRLIVYRPTVNPKFGIGVGVPGISCRYDQVTLVGTKLSEYQPVKPLSALCRAHEVTDDAPAVVLRAASNPTTHLPVLVPLEYLDPDTGKQALPRGLFGLYPSGNFAGTEDCRWAELNDEVGGAARLRVVAIHDNLITIEDYVEVQAAMKELIRQSTEVRKRFSE